MKVLLVDGTPCFYRPENENDEREMIESLYRDVSAGRLKVPGNSVAAKSLMSLSGKSLEDALTLVRSDPTLQALCSSAYAGEHPTYDPSKVNEVDAEKEMAPNALSDIRAQIKRFGVAPLKRETP